MGREFSWIRAMLSDVNVLIEVGGVFRGVERVVVEGIRTSVDWSALAVDVETYFDVDSKK